MKVLPSSFLATASASLFALQVAGFELRLLGLEIFAVGLGGAQGLLLRQQEIAGEAVLDPHFVAHLAELLDPFEQNHLHGRSPHFTT